MSITSVNETADALAARFTLDLDETNIDYTRETIAVPVEALDTMLDALARERYCNHDALAISNGRCECGAEIWFVWRVPVEEHEGARLIIPRSDPHKYEQAADLLHTTADEARAWFDEELAAAEDDDDEIAYMNRWVLCQETVERVR